MTEPTTAAGRELFDHTERLGYSAYDAARELMETRGGGDWAEALALVEQEAIAFTVEQVKRKAEAFWSEESVERDYAFHPSLLWSWLNAVASDSGQPQLPNDLALPPSAPPALDVERLAQHFPSNSDTGIVHCACNEYVDYDGDRDGAAERWAAHCLEQDR